jgi:hypothetical protein
VNYLTLPSGFRPERSSFPPNSIFVFDFDGVLTSQMEEQVYRLSEIENERKRLEHHAGTAGIDASLYSTPYLRHLVFQSRYDRVCQPHVLAEFARELDVPYFVLTLRSGLHALQRMMTFLDVMHLYPQELFCVGRVSKARTLEALLEYWPDRHIVFFDDSMRHIEDACAIQSNRLTNVFVEWPEDPWEANDHRWDYIMNEGSPRERAEFLQRLMTISLPIAGRNEFLGELGPQ